MNKDILKGKWSQMKGSVTETWGKLTDDDVAKVDGNYEKLSGLLQEKYGKNREAVEREIDDWARRHA